MKNFDGKLTQDEIAKLIATVRQNDRRLIELIGRRKGLNDGKMAPQYPVKRIAKPE